MKKIFILLFIANISKAQLPAIVGSGTNIVTDSLKVWIDAAYLNSYKRTSGTSIYNLINLQDSSILINGASWANNKGGEFTFDGVNDYVNISNLIINTSNFSIAWFIKPTAYTNYNNQISSSGDWGTFVSHTTNSGAMYVGTDVSTRFSPTQLPAGTLQTNVYQMFCFVLNGTTASFYKNGSLLASKTVTAPVAATGFLLGNATSNTINGTIPIFLYYKKSLSATEVLQNYNALKNRFQ